MVATAPAIALDSYVLDVLMRDLVGHDKKPSAFIVYLYLAVRILESYTVTANSLPCVKGSRACMHKGCLSTSKKCSAKRGVPGEL